MSSQMELGTAPIAIRIRLEDLIDEFVSDVCAGKTNETPIAYRAKLKRLSRYLGDGPITAKSIKDFQHHLLTRKTHKRGPRYVAGGLSLNTVKTVMQTTRHFCRWLHDQGYITEDIAKTIKLPKVPPPQPKAISHDTVLKLLEGARKIKDDWQRIRDVAIIYLLVDTGGRIGGLINARVDGVDLKRGVIETVEKGRPVTLFINKPTIQVLRAWLEQRAKPHSYPHGGPGKNWKTVARYHAMSDALFISRESHEGVGREALYNIMRKLATLGGVKERCNYHSFRHAFARDFLLAGGELSQLSRIMHHSSIWVTSNYYARWDTTELQEAHAKSSPIHNLVEECNDEQDL